MPICQLCEKSFKNHQEIDGKIRNLGNRRYCLECSPFGIHNTKQLTKSHNLRTQKECPSCKKVKKLNEFYVTPSKIQSYCKFCFNNYQKNKWTKYKIQMVKEFGGKCQICGYDKNYASLTFHHKDPGVKDASWTKLKLRSIDKIRKELKKCQLLCNNCHGEVHHPEAILNN